MADRITDLEQEMMDLEYQQEMAHFNRVKDEPGLQEVSLFAPKAPVRILSQAVNTIELIRANLPAIRAAAARQKQNPKAGLNRIIKIIEELD